MNGRKDAPDRLRNWLAEGLSRVAAARLGRRYPEWAKAMLGEQASLADERDRLGWAVGSLGAGFRLSVSDDALYPALLLLSLAAMALYQWSADESGITVLVLSALGLVLGLCSPRRFVVSGVAVGAVVAAVTCFETVSGVRPPYEAHAHSLAHNLRWLVLVLPALASTLLGRALNLGLLA